MHRAVDIETGGRIVVEEAENLYTKSLVSSKRFYCPYCQKRVIPVRPWDKKFHWRHVDGSPGCPEYFPGRGFTSTYELFLVRQFLSRYGYFINDNKDPFEPDLTKNSIYIWIKPFDTLIDWEQEDLDELARRLNEKSVKRPVLIITKSKLTIKRQFSQESGSSLENVFCEKCGGILIHDYQNVILCPKCAHQKELKEPDYLLPLTDRPSETEKKLARSMGQTLISIHVGEEKGFSGPIGTRWQITMDPREKIEVSRPFPLGVYAYNNFDFSQSPSIKVETFTDRLTFELGQMVSAMGDIELKNKNLTWDIIKQTLRRYLLEIDRILGTGKPEFIL